MTSRTDRYAVMWFAASLLEDAGIRGVQIRPLISELGPTMSTEERNEALTRCAEWCAIRGILCVAPGMTVEK